MSLKLMADIAQLKQRVAQLEADLAQAKQPLDDQLRALVDQKLDAAVLRVVRAALKDAPRG